MKAFHAIQSLGLAPPDDSTRATVHKLLGSTLPSADVPPEDTEWRTVMLDNSFESAPLTGLSKSLLRMKRNKAFDHHGWTAESARVLLGDARVWQCIENWLTHLAAVECNESILQVLHSCKCVPLRKAQNGVRPILIPTLWAKLISSSILQAQEEALVPLFRDKQWALGESNSTTKFVYAVCEAMRQHPEYCSIQVDLENAFPSLDRAFLRDTFSHYGLEHAHLLSRYITAPRTPWFAGAKQPLYATHRGLIQGDPLSTSLFALALLRCTELAAPQMPPNAELRAYVDDAVLTMHPEHAAEAWQALEDALASANLRIKAPKCRLWLQQGHACDVHPLSTIVQACADTRGLHLVGIRATAWSDAPLPLGGPAFVQEHLATAATSLTARAKVLTTTMLVAEEHEPVHQILLHFAQHMVPSLFMHHFRAVPVCATLPLAQAAQLVVEQMLQSITHSFLQDWQLQLAHLPTHMGGLSVPYLPTLCCLARYASLWQLQQPNDSG
eukprot:6198854-Amphidinium_carterae.1